MMVSLNNKRILVTREEKSAKLFSEKLTTYGGIPIIVPLIEINCLPIEEEFNSLHALSRFDWVFFTSKNGVDCFLQTESLKKALKNCRIAAVGSKTELALNEQGFSVDFVPTTYNAEVMAKEFFENYPTSGPVLLVRGSLARPILPEALKKAGHAFTCLEVYETVARINMKEKLQTILNEEDIDYYTFTSPSTIDAFVALGEPASELFNIPAVCIGTTTANHAKKLGFKQTIVPEQFTVERMIEVMSQDINRRGGENQ